MQSPIARRRRRIPNRGPGRGVYSPSNYGTKPCSIYFYYLVPGRNGDLTATASFFENGVVEITYQHLKERAAILVGQVRQGHITHAPDPCEDIEICWRRRSWLLYVLGDPALQFVQNPMRFETEAGTNLAYNHAFMDGREFPVDLDSGERLSATACINHMYANEHQDDLEVLGDYQEFDIRLSYNRMRGGWIASGPLEYDSGGTNMGPPVPPPTY